MIYLLFGVVCFLLFKEYKKKLTKIKFKGITWKKRDYKHDEIRVIEKFCLIPRTVSVTKNDEGETFKEKVWLCRVEMTQKKDINHGYGCDTYSGWNTVSIKKVEDE